MDKRFIFPIGLLVLIIIGCLLFKPIVHPIHLGGDNAENYRDTVDRNSISTIFDPFLITTSLGANTYFCPMQSIVWYFLVKNFQMKTQYYPLFALIVHITCALLAASVARALLSSDIGGLLAGSTFLVFFPHVSTIKFISAVITHGLCVAFYLAGILTFYYYLKSRFNVYYFLSLFFFILAHLSKETAWSMLPLMMTMEYFLFLNPKEKKINFNNIKNYLNKYFVFLFILLGAITIFVLKYPYGEISHSWGGSSMSVNILFRFFDLLTMMIAPIKSINWLKLILVNLTLLGIFILSCYGSPTLRVLLIWLIIAILPFCLSNFRPTNSLTRYLYLASIPFAIGLSYAAIWAKNKSISVRIPLSAIPVVALCSHAIAAVIALWR